MSATRRVPLLLGIGLAVGGQLVLLQTTRTSPSEGLAQALAGVMLVTGACLFGARAKESVSTLPRLEFPLSNVPSFAPARNRWMTIWLLAAIAVAVLALILFVTVGENQIVRWLWLTSIGALLIGTLNGIKLKVPRIADGEQVYLALLAVILVAAFASRVYHLTELPYNVDGDFADVGLQARALAQGQEPRIFAYGWAQVPMLGYLPAWLTMRVFGDGLAGLNASGVIEGLLVIVGVYLLGRDLFHARVGLFAAAVLTISYAHLAASRQSSYIDPVLAMLFAIYFLLVGLRESRTWAVVVSGIVTALCIQMYYSGRLVLFVAAFLVLYLLLFRRVWFRARWRLLLLYGLAILVTLGPMLVVFASTPEGFVTRARFVFIFVNPDAIRHLQGAYHVDSLAAVMLEQARRTALLFHYYWDTGTQFGFSRPFLDPSLATLFTLGVGYALFHARRLGDALLLAWLGFGVVLGSFVTLDPPFWTRLMILLPPTALLAARALDLIYAQVSPSLTLPGNNTHRLTAAILASVLTVVGILNWNTYVQVKGFTGTEVTRMGRYLAAQPPTVHGYLVSDKFSYDVRQLEFIAPNRLVANLKPEDDMANIARVGSPTLLFLTNEQGATVEKLKQLYPNGAAETHIGNTPDEIAFYVFRLP